MAWEEDSCICLNMQLIAILSRIGVIIVNDGSNDDTEIYIRLPALNNSTSTLITGKL